jgi:hypothetical protein
MIKGGASTKDVAAYFLGFWGIPMRTSHLDALRNHLRRQSKPSSASKDVEHESGPKWIDYANCLRSATIRRDAAPLNAGIYPAFGQTPDPAGHRA